MGSAFKRLAQYALFRTSLNNALGNVAETLKNRDVILLLPKKKRKSLIKREMFDIERIEAP